MEEKKTKPHLFNLNFDPQLSGRLGRRRLLNVGSVELGKEIKGRQAYTQLHGKRFFLQVRGEKNYYKKLKYDSFQLCKNSFSKFCSFKHPKGVFLPNFKNKYQV
jgi:hypothetical protein